MGSLSCLCLRHKARNHRHLKVKPLRHRAAARAYLVHQRVAQIQEMGKDDSPQVIHVYGYGASLKLDARFRFRLPDDLSGHLRTELGRLAGDSPLPTAMLSRLSFYLVPGPHARLLLYPGPNIRVAIDCFENPQVSGDPAQIRQARDYFYKMMRFVETDTQGRILLPEHLRRHAGIATPREEVVLTGHNLWLTLVRGSLAAEEDLRGREALDAFGADVIDPVRPVQYPTESEAD